MFERNLISELRDWAAKPGHKPLVLRGARQVGKSTLANQFGEEYDVYLKLNLELSAHADLFRHGYTIQEILPLIYYLNRKERIAGKTLLFIDEIQACPEAVAALRYFYEEAPDIDVIAAGSLLESLIDKHISFPVGRVAFDRLSGRCRKICFGSKSDSSDTSYPDSRMVGSRRPDNI